MPERTATTEIIVQNMIQDATQISALSYGNNLPLNPTVEDLNRIVSGYNQSCSEAEPAKEERLFGNHIREAVALVKDWVQNP